MGKDCTGNDKYKMALKPKLLLRKRYLKREDERKTRFDLALRVVWDKANDSRIIP